MAHLSNRDAPQSGSAGVWLLLARRYTEHPEHTHDCKVVVIRSNLRWCSDGLEFDWWNGDIVRAALIINAHDREVISWRAVANAGISGSDVRDMLLEAVRLGSAPAGHRNHWSS